ncbi:MBL fold metallo-hydrolase [Amycolatopsis rhabdoformis]|uniref:MBL fold metallo-hydrolase n=1 Tax=Amycolatopsis rhabdoformis TaxID=1448059 RepID=A0ABZ1HWK2_9PSEU|nr:MBL fold metallo-hydrolase [Amycolatopsis rhabdoformis]WSE26564.1 MBL fold metallo-hydrolase [Amycolatopsis rhabdoformis]
MTSFTLRHLGGPTSLITYAGVRLLTDPTFDEAGEYPIGNRVLVKTMGPVATAAEVGAVDAVLLSHDQHADNLDHGGRAYLETAPLTLTTASAAERLGGTAQALPNWSHVDLPGGVRVTGVPALHGPEGAEDKVGEVTGFLLSADGRPTVYVSGDNASLDRVRAIAGRYGPVPIAVLFAGAARTPLIDAYLTLESTAAAEAAELLQATDVVPLHFQGWGHFTQGPDTLTAAFEGKPARLHLLEPGQEVSLG